MTQTYNISTRNYGKIEFTRTEYGEIQIARNKPGDQGWIPYDSIKPYKDNPDFAIAVKDTNDYVTSALKDHDPDKDCIHNYLNVPQGTIFFAVQNDPNNNNAVKATILKTAEEDQNDLCSEYMESIKTIVVIVQFVVIIAYIFLI